MLYLGPGTLGVPDRYVHTFTYSVGDCLFWYGMSPWALGLPFRLWCVPLDPLCVFVSTLCVLAVPGSALQVCVV